MSRQRLDEIKRKQLPDAEKRQRADFVVQTGLGKRASRVALARFLRKLKHR
jgi:dephospho-CoA kinase